LWGGRASTKKKEGIGPCDWGTVVFESRQKYCKRKTSTREKKEKTDLTRESVKKNAT